MEFNEPYHEEAIGGDIDMDMEMMSSCLALESFFHRVKVEGVVVVTKMVRPRLRLGQ